jgi:hypothetical protein
MTARLWGVRALNCRQDAVMIFVQHHGSSLIDAARSAEGVLLLGRLGQGVGLLSDLLAAAAAECGRPANCEELHGFAQLRPSSAAAVWLGVSEAPPVSTGYDVPRFDVVVALDRIAIPAAYRLVKPSGRVLLPLPQKEHASASRFGALAGLQPATSQGEQVFIVGTANHSTVSIGYLAGCLSGCLSLPERAWRAALHSHLRPRDRRRAQAQFAAGRQQMIAPRTFWRWMRQFTRR